MRELQCRSLLHLRHSMSAAVGVNTITFLFHIAVGIAEWFRKRKEKKMDAHKQRQTLSKRVNEDSQREFHLHPQLDCSIDNSSQRI